MRYIRRLLRLYQGFVISGVVLVFGAGTIIFAVIPGVGATRDLYDRLTVVRQEGDAMRAKLQLLKALSEEDIRDRLVILLAGIPQEKSVPSVLGTVDGLARETGVSVIDLGLTSLGSLASVSASTRPSASEKKIGASTLAFTLTASGTYDQIRAFVGTINQVRRIFDITSFDLSISASGVTQVRLSLAAYYQPIPTKIASIQSPVVPLSTKEETIFRTIQQYPDISQGISESLSPSLSGGKRDPFAR